MLISYDLLNGITHFRFQAIPFGYRLCDFLLQRNKISKKILLNCSNRANTNVSGEANARMGLIKEVATDHASREVFKIFRKTNKTFQFIWYFLGVLQNFHLLISCCNISENFLKFSFLENLPNNWQNFQTSIRESIWDSNCQKFLVSHIISSVYNYFFPHTARNFKVLKFWTLLRKYQKQAISSYISFSSLC